MTKSHLKIAAIVILYLCATLQFIRFYTVSTVFYLNLPAYLSGHERLPFQERILPIFFLKLFYGSGFLGRFANHTKGAFTPERAGLFVISFVSLIVAGIFAQLLYKRLTRLGSLQFLVFPAFLFAAMWSYSIHVEANFSYPYDFLSLAFFTAGVYFIYTRQFLYLVIVMFLGTLNRETTLFLIGIYVLDAASTNLSSPTGSIRDRFSFTAVPWFRVTLLLFIWCSIKLTLAHIFAHNDASENYVRLGENVGRLTPRLWPALLNVCGFLLPAILLFSRSIYPLRFRNYLWILPVWFATAFYTGVIVETRIYGELCALTAIGLVLIAERNVETNVVACALDDVQSEPVTLKDAA